MTAVFQESEAAHIIHSVNREKKNKYKLSFLQEQTHRRKQEKINK